MSVTRLWGGRWLANHAPQRSRVRSRYEALASSRTTVLRRSEKMPISGGTFPCHSLGLAQRSPPRTYRRSYPPDVLEGASMSSQTSQYILLNRVHFPQSSVWLQNPR